MPKTVGVHIMPPCDPDAVQEATRFDDFFSALNLWFGLALNQFFLANLLFLFWYESVYMQLYVGSMQISFRLLWRLMAKSLLWVSEETLYFWSSAGVLKILETFKAEQNVFSIMR